MNSKTPSLASTIFFFCEWLKNQKKMRWEKALVSSEISNCSGPGQRWGHTCNAIKGGRFLYVFGGYGQHNCQTNQVDVFDTGNPPRFFLLPFFLSQVCIFRLSFVSPLIKIRFLLGFLLGLFGISFEGIYCWVWRGLLGSLFKYICGV